MRPSELDKAQLDALMVPFFFIPFVRNLLMESENHADMGG